MSINLWMTSPDAMKAMKRHVNRWRFERLVTALLMYCLMPLIGSAASRTLEFETDEVTQPALTLAPDGRSVVFNLLGHLFSMPVGGGPATQMTFGPYYDSEPVYGEDSNRIAFVSNRDGSDGNIFILDLSSRKISQVTHEFLARMPAWSPDGKTIAYISYLRREEYPLDRVPGFSGGEMGTLSIIPAQGGTPQRIGGPRSFSSISYFSDGRLGWAVAERAQNQQTMRATQQASIAATVIEVRNPDGTISRLGSIPGQTGRVTLDPRGIGFYYVAGGSLRQYLFAGAESKVLGPFAGGGIWLDVDRGGQRLYAAADAKFWRIRLPGSEREQIPMQARVKMDTVIPSVRKWVSKVSSTATARVVLTPRLSPDGRTLVFAAAGYLWGQKLDGGEAKRLVEETSYQSQPTFSPDGAHLAFVSDRQGKRELRIYDFATRRSRAVYSVGGASWVVDPTWSSDGKTIVFQRTDALGAPYRFLQVNANDSGQPVLLGQSGRDWNGRPHLSADERSLYYTAQLGTVANLYRLPLREDAKPEAVTDLTRHVHDGLVSPDGKWVAFRRNSEIWLASMANHPLKDEDFHRVSSDGGRSFAFTADSSAIIYAEGSKVWRREIPNKRSTEIPVRLTLHHAVAAPLLIGNIHILDLRAGSFTDKTSMLIENGRIRWIGPADGRTLPSGLTRIDGGGRYAIPGVIDVHVHSAWANQQITEDSLIAYGVTSVRDLGSRFDILKTLMDRGYATDLPVPRYFASGEIFEGFMPLWGDAFLEITTPEEARLYVQRAKAAGADFIKVYASLPWYLKSEVAAEAARLGMPIAGHGLSVEEIVRSVNFGITSLEHTGPTNDDILKLLASAGTYWDPTPTVFTAGTPLMLSNPNTLDRKFRTFMPEDSIAAAGPGRKVSDAQRAAWKRSLANFRRFHESGVKLMAGTDALMTGVFFGPSVHWVLQWYQEAGIPTIDLLRMVTLDASKLVGAEEDLGSLESGKIADVLLLDADPLADISNTMRIWRVVRDGHVFDPTAMR